MHGAIFWAWRVVWDNGHPVQAAARGLGARSPSDRLAAVREISGLGFRLSGEALRALTPALTDPDAEVRTAAAQSVGLVSSYAASAGSEAETIGEAWTRLIGLLGDPRAEVRGAAATSLGIIATVSLGGPGRGRRPSEKGASPTLDVEMAAGALTGLLEDGDVAVRLAAIGALGALAPKATGGPPKPLFTALEEESAENRAAAALALSGYRNGLDPLIAILLRNIERDGLPVHRSYISALTRIRPPAVSAAVVPALVAALGNRDRDVRLQVVLMLSRLAPDARPAIPGLITILNEPTESDEHVPDRSPYPTFRGPAHSAAQARARSREGRNPPAR